MPESTAIAKIEELEDNNDQLMSAPPLPAPTVNPDGTVKRGRGRPRKYPVSQLKTVQKVTKGRSKTGCITCRRRKKKCDEMKPECNNCVKNSVVCEGYPERTYWQPGRTTRNSVFISRSLPTLIDGIETKVDQKLLDHFTHRVSRILTLFEDENNPFHDHFLPLAMQHQALMHSLLALSSSHLLNTTGSESQDHQRAYQHHFIEATRCLRERISSQVDEKDAATTLILCLVSICCGNTDGGYRPHLNAARVMLGFTKPEAEEDTALRQFLYEFFTYHDVANSITILDSQQEVRDHLELPGFIRQPAPDAGALLGVLDGLFGYMSKITLLRQEIRRRKAAGINPSIDYAMLSQAVAIDTEIRDWEPNHEPGSTRHAAAQLYRQCTWLYLYRTIQPSRDCDKIRSAVDAGLGYLRALPENSGAQSILLMPLFLLGCAAFNPEHRPEISRRFIGLYEWSGLANILPAHKIVQRIWELMDSGDMELSWDWESIIKDMGYDFLVT